MRQVCLHMIFLLFIPHYLLDLIERTFKKFYKNKGTLYLACNDKEAFFTSTNHRGYTLSHYRFEIRRNSVKSTVRSEIDHFRCKIGSGW